MSITAELADGRRLEFPDGTESAVIQGVVKKMSVPSSPVESAPQKGYVEGRIDAVKNAAQQAVSPDFWKGIGKDLTNFPPVTPETVGQVKELAMNSALSTLPTTRVPKFERSVVVEPVWNLAKKVGSSVRDTADLFLPGGSERIADRYGAKIVGEGNIPKVVQALKDAKQIIPGSNPTSAEAVAFIPEGSPILAHQKIVAETPGGISAEFGKRTLEQQTARQTALSPIAQDKAALAAAEGVRAGHALKNYGEAYKQIIKADPDLSKLGQNPYFKDALPDAIKLAEARGINPKENLTEFLHLVKLSLDKTLGKTGDTALSNTERLTVEGVKKQLIEWIGKKNPAYEKARSVFATESKPINQMEVGQYLKDKLLSPLNETERASAYAQALRDAPGTLKRSTGFKRFEELGQVLTPEQEKVARAVAEDLSRKSASLNPSQKTALQGGVNVAEETRAHIPQLLSRPAMIANAVMRYAGMGIEPKVDQIMAARYLEPQALAKAMEKVSPTQRNMIIEAIMNSRNSVVPRGIIAQQEQQ